MNIFVNYVWVSGIFMAIVANTCYTTSRNFCFIFSFSFYLSIKHPTVFSFVFSMQANVVDSIYLFFCPSLPCVFSFYNIQCDLKGTCNKIDQRL